MLFLIYKSCQRESKINYYSCFLNRGTSQLIKLIYKEIGIALTEKKKKLITNSQQNIKLKHVMLGPFQTWNFL